MAETQVFVYRDNTGGSNLRSNEMNINQSMQKTEMVYIQNMEIYREGGFQAQKGNTQINTGVSDTSKVLGVGEYRTAAAVYAVYTKASGKCYVMPAAGGAETEIKSGLSATAIPKFVNYNGEVGCFNGVDTPFFYDGVTTPAPNVTTPPALWSTTKPQTVCNLRAGRLLSAAGSTLNWCKQGDQDNWTAASDAGSITDIFTDVASINAVETYGQSCSIHTNSKRIYVLSGSTYSDYAATPMASNRSATGKHAIATINDNQFFFSGDSILPIITTDLGVVRLGKDTEISYKIHPFLSGTESDLPVSPIDRAYNGQVILLPYDTKNELIAYFRTQNSGVSAFDTAAIFNFNSGSWVFRKATAVTAAGIVNGNVLTGTSDGKILQEFSGTSIVGGGTYQKEIVSPFFDFGAPHLRKRIIRFWIWVKAEDDLTLSSSWKTDYQTTERLHRDITVEIDSLAASYNVGEYNVNTYASPSVGLTNFPTNLTAKSFQFVLTSDDSNVDFRILGYGFEVEFLDGD